MSSSSESIASTPEHSLPSLDRSLRVGVLLAAIGLLNLSVAAAVLFQWPAPLLNADVDWLITFDLADVHVHRTLWTTALACAQVSLLALWCGSGCGRPASRWLALAGGIVAWSAVLEFLHPAVARAADSRALFALQAAMILAVLTALRLIRPSKRREQGTERSRQWTLKHWFWLTAIAGLVLASSRFVQPDLYSSPTRSVFSYWRVAVAGACALIALAAWWASVRPWRRAPAAIVAFALAGSGLAWAFAKLEFLWPPSHNPGEAHYPEVFRAFWLSYLTWAVIQGVFIFTAIVLATSRSRGALRDGAASVAQQSTL